MRIRIIDLERYGGPRGLTGIELHGFIFKGGGGSAPAVVPAPAAPTLPLVAPAAPAATASALDVQQSVSDARKASKAKKGLNQTILAGSGDEAGNALGGPQNGKNTLLGGG